MASLPPYLLNAWRLKRGELQQALDEGQFNKCTTSSIAEAYLRFQSKERQTAGDEHPSADSPPSLFSIVVGRVLDDVKPHDNLLIRLEMMVEDLRSAILRNFPDDQILAENLASTILQKMLYDQRTPYKLLRQFAVLPEFSAQDGRTLVDIDEAVLRNERYVRSQRNNGQDCMCLITLEELFGILCKSSQDGAPVTIRRQNPPKGGFEILDELRPKELSIQPSSAAFARTFDRITNHILCGLDWNNVLLAGDIVSITLLHTDLSRDKVRSVLDPEITLYLYGLAPNAANRKLRHIHDTWVRNLKSIDDQRLVVKTSKTITFLTSYPNRRVQIALKLPHSPTDVLLGFDLDASAIGYDGSQVLMLPRCARAIETGYSVFTMDLVWDHYISDRRATQDSRIFKYANRGFGIRFLPSYARSLENDDLESVVYPEVSISDPSEDIGDENTESTQRLHHLNRKPYGKEHGLKTLKRIAYLGRDFVTRFYFGCSKLAISPKQYERQMRASQVSQGLTNGEVISPSDLDEEEKWRDIYRVTLDDYIAKVLHKDIQVKNDIPRIHLGVLDTKDLHPGLPGGRKGLGTFEIFMRHCEAWRLQARHEAILLRDDSLDDDDPHKFEDLPFYSWDVTFDVGDLADDIEGRNEELWEHLKVAICSKLRIPYASWGGYKGYTTRRMRYSVLGESLAKVLAKQITLPVVLPWTLEKQLRTLFKRRAVPAHQNKVPLVPVHDASAKHSSILPSLRDTDDECGNLRYWVITNQDMWNHQEPLLHEFSNLMWSMVHRFHHAMEEKANHAVGPNTDSEDSVLRLAQSLRHRIVLPGISFKEQVPIETTRYALPPLREALLFRPWVLANTAIPDRWKYHTGPGPTAFHRIFRDEYFEYPFDDSLFWKEGDEGQWAGNGAPAWVDIPL